MLRNSKDMESLRPLACCMFSIEQVNILHCIDITCLSVCVPLDANISEHRAKLVSLLL